MTDRPPKDPTSTIDIGTFKRAAARYPTGVVIVSARTGSHDHAMTVNSFTTVSLEPPLVLFCVERDARFHDAVTHKGHFGVSILAAQHRSVATWLSTPGRPLVGQLDQIPHEYSPNGCALIGGALAHLEAEITDVHSAGDHSIVVGLVTHLAMPDVPAAPLVYVRSGYHTQTPLGPAE